MPTSGIYAVRNKINGKVYVGKSVDITHRWCSHKARLRRGVHVNTHLQRAWNLYGEGAFECEVVHRENDRTLLPQLEAQYVLDFSATDPEKGYNLNVVDTHSYRASPETRAKQSAAQKARHAAHPRTCTPEQRARMSAAQKARGATASAETRAKMSAGSKGKKKSLEHRDALIAAHTGWVPSQETRDKIGAAHRGRKASPGTRAKMSATRKGKKRGPYRKHAQSVEENK